MMERRSLVALLIALLVLTPSAVSFAASPEMPATEPACIKLADDDGQHSFTLAETLNFLRRPYTDPNAVGDPLCYARDLCLRGELLAYFLRHSGELARSGFFRAHDEESRQAVAASLSSRFVSPQMAATLTPKDILALHTVVYATSGPAVFDQFMSQNLAGAALEGKDYAYLAQLKHYVLQASEELSRVRALSGMYSAAPAGIEPACSATCPSAGGEEHQCSGDCKKEGKCTGSCGAAGGHEGEHKCSGDCKSGGKCTGACATRGGCSGKCSGGCAREGGKAPSAGTGLSPKVFSDLSRIR